MHTYIVRVYRARPEVEGSVSGIIEDIESGQLVSWSERIFQESD